MCVFSADNVPVRAIDDGQESPSLQHLLTSDMVDDTCRIRLWVEQRRDGGFWEAEKDHPRLQMPIGLGRPRRPTKRESFGGVRLACMSEMPPWDMQQPLVWGAAGGEIPHPNNSHGQQSAAAVGTEMEMEEDELSIVSGEDDAVGAAGITAHVDDDHSDPAGTTRGRETRILVFLKTVGFGNTMEAGAATAAAVRHRGVGDVGGVSSGSRSSTWGPKYLTHAILRASSPLRTLFELAADRLGDGTRPEDLGAYLEDLPCAWQDTVKEQQPAKAAQAGQVDPVWRATTCRQLPWVGRGGKTCAISSLCVIPFCVVEVLVVLPWLRLCSPCFFLVPIYSKLVKHVQRLAALACAHRQ